MWLSLAVAIHRRRREPEAIILAGGLGERLLSSTQAIPNREYFGIDNLIADTAPNGLMSSRPSRLALQRRGSNGASP